MIIGDFPPSPPGYDPSTWRQGIWDNGRWTVTSPEGRVYTIHPEDKGHWRHWDIQNGDGSDGGSWPPNSKKPWPGQKKPKADQCTTDPSGNTDPWKPVDPYRSNTSPFISPVLPGLLNPQVPGGAVVPVRPPVWVPVW